MQSAVGLASSNQQHRFADWPFCKGRGAQLGGIPGARVLETNGRLTCTVHPQGALDDSLAQLLDFGIFFFVTEY